MPVIALNVSKQVYDAYHEIKKGKRSERMNNALERHFRLLGNDEYNKMNNLNLQIKIKEREEGINSLQTIITNLSEDLEKEKEMTLRMRILKVFRSKD